MKHLRWMARLACALVMVSLSLLPLDAAFAEFDPASFGEKLKAAEQAYLDGDYAAARAAYQELDTSLSAALANGEIPAGQEDRARGALTTIVYQIGRSEQKLGDCVAAEKTFEGMSAEAGTNPELQAKLDVRQVEIDLCIAEAALASGDAATAAQRLDSVESGLTKVTGEDAATLADALESHRGTLWDQQYSVAEQAAAGGDCEGAYTQLDALQGPEARAAAARATVDGSCESGFDDLEPWLAWGLVGVGGVLVTVAVILEVVAAGDVDDFETARDGCVSGDSAACQTALDIKDDLESQQVTTIVLATTGALAVAGGLVWYFVFVDDEGDAEGLSFGPAIGPDSIGMTLGVTW